MPSMNRPRQLAASNAPGKSKAWLARGVRGKVFSPIAIATRPKGMLTANSQGHGPSARMPEAMVGPSVKAVATTMRVVTEAAALQVPGIDETNQRRIHAHDAAGAEALQHARSQQAGQRPRAGAGERGQREQQKSREVDPAVTDDFAERRERQQRRHQRDLIDVHHPDDVGRPDMQVGRDGGKCHVGDRGIERGHGQRGENRRRRPIPALGRQAIDRSRLVRRNRFRRHSRGISRWLEM